MKDWVYEGLGICLSFHELIVIRLLYKKGFMMTF